MNIQQALARLAQRENLTREEACQMITYVMSGKATESQIGGLLMALSTKGETVAELTGAVEAMRALARKVTIDAPNLVDTCGTGGSGGAKLFNVSTAAAFVTAAAGAHVAKHGNRKMSSTSGSADILEAAGVNIELTSDQVSQCVSQIGIGFLFAQAHHSAMRHAAATRKALGVRTLFNLLGPMTNPAGAKQQVIGVFDAAMIRPMVEVLAQLESRHVLVVHSPNPNPDIAQGLDELSLGGTSQIAELKDGVITEYTLSPADVGLSFEDQTSLQARTAEESLSLFKQSLSEPGTTAANLVVYNAGASIYASGIADTLSDGVAQAHQAIASGAAIRRLTQLINLSQSFATP